jgi:AcrR family transcriptional regulator
MPPTARAASGAAAVDPVTPISGKAPRSVRRPEVEHRLIEAVRQLSADGTSFSDVSVSQLVTQAGLARATFYLYFDDRSAFVQRLLEHAYQQLVEGLSTFWQSAVSDRARLEDATSQFVDTFAANYPIVAAIAATAATDTRVADRVAETMQAYITQGEATIVDAQRRGLVSRDIPPFETAASLVWMTDQACLRLAGNPDPAAHARLAKALATIGWNTLHG